jgi:hypothetical protein
VGRDWIGDAGPAARRQPSGVDGRLHAVVVPLGGRTVADDEAAPPLAELVADGGAGRLLSVALPAGRLV